MRFNIHKCRNIYSKYRNQHWFAYNCIQTPTNIPFTMIIMRNISNLHNTVNLCVFFYLCISFLVYTLSHEANKIRCPVDRIFKYFVFLDDLVCFYYCYLLRDGFVYIKQIIGVFINFLFSTSNMIVTITLIIMNFCNQEIQRSLKCIYIYM